jgi:hypothetical protein
MKCEIGNNIESAKTFQLKVLLYSENSLGDPGVKYFFPEAPILKDKNIVGIDVNLNNDNILLDPAPIFEADLKAPTNILNPAFDNLLRINQAKNIFCTIYGNDNDEKFYNVPLRSFFMQPSSSLFGLNKKPRRVKPYSGKINPRKSFLYIPVNYTALIGLRFYVLLTFYYN